MMICHFPQFATFLGVVLPYLSFPDAPMPISLNYPLASARPRTVGISQSAEVINNEDRRPDTEPGRLQDKRRRNDGRRWAEPDIKLSSVDSAARWPCINSVRLAGAPARQPNAFRWKS